MDIKKLSNIELINRFGKLVQTERKITHLVLECIAEIDTRKIYLERAYPSLYEFLIKEFGYSPSAAVRRIESARLLREVPEFSEKIEEGSLNLSQLSKVQQAIRIVQKTKARKVHVEEKRELLRKIENTSQDQTELILSQELSLPICYEEREKIHRDESVTLTIPFSKDQMALLEQVKDLLSHSVEGGKWADIIAYLARKEIQKKTKIKRQSKPAIQTKPAAIIEVLNGADKDTNLSSTKPSIAATRKPIAISLRKGIFTRDKCCQYRDPATNKICGATRFLEIDHVQPIWAGGTNKIENLRVLCSQHNKFKYRKEAGLQP